jgi:calcineurin-binding protein cabin-1
VQTLCKIVSNQLDLDPSSKAIPPKQHCIETAVPWIILHHILQKEDDRSSVARKALKENELSSEEIEFSLPNAVLLLFTAHDSLGRRQWCTKDNSQLLLYILNVIVPPLRSPLLEPCRDIVNEYLEQVTYCLYGFPTKKARLRHIEEHDAKNIELTWERGIQLFNIYRPDHLPEFDSYK